MSAPGNSLDERRRNWIIDKLAGSSAENGRQDAVEPPPPGVTAAHTPRAQGSAPDGVNSVDEERVVGTDIHVSNLSTDVRL